MKRLVFLAAASSLLWACGQPGNIEDAAEEASACPRDAGPVAVIDPWVRAAGTGQATALYMTLCNTQRTADALVEARTAAADVAELHETRRSPDGIASMAQRDSFDLPPSDSFALAPGGAHVMLIGVREPLAEGSTVTVTLVFRNGPPVTIEAPVKAAGGSHHAH